MTENMTYTERFAAELRSRRGFLDLSQNELSKRSDVNSRSISQYENETCAPTLESIAKLARALGCTPNDLLGWK